MIAVLREVVYLACRVIAVVCGIASATIAVSIVAGKFPDADAWMMVVFFAAVGAASWIASNAARI